MKNTIKLEIHKAIKNKLFVISVLLGCAITILSLIYQVNVSSLDFAASGKNPMISAYTVFSTWIGGDGYSLGASVYFFIFPLLISIPYGWSYCEEKKNGYIGAVVVKAVRDVIKAKKQGEELKTALDDFYEEELNWWDREHEEGEEL